jgi:2-polyprenyl-3-methyl-5-hydroxy-6-metoxy-1,4-benzoquinol methylase
MTSQIEELVEHENKYWSEVFKNEKLDLNKDLFSHYWWKIYYQSIVNEVNSKCDLKIDDNILELGSGSGKSSILLGTKFNITLLDISKNALEYAKLISSKFNSQNIEYIEANFFEKLKFNRKFKLVWNIGVIEHYEDTQIEQIFEQMLRQVESNGYVIFGVPNFYTGASLKAYLLKFPIFKKFQGYRLDSEKFYTQKHLKTLFNRTAVSLNLNIIQENTSYHGNPLPIESPIWLQNTFGNLLGYIFPPLKFLTIYTFKIHSK